MEKKNYYLGLDIGTNSVGYAVTNKQYNLLKYKGEPMWGAHIFEEGKQCAERRSFRTSRRRLNRKQQRVQLVQELFANEIAKVDERFFVRLNESALYREDTSGNDPYIFFNDKEYNDKHYFREYPTIHHLIMSLIEEDKMHDIRLVYMAVAWLVAHRGHFLNEVDKSNVDKILDFENTYNRLCEYYNANGFNIPWKDDIEGFKEVLLEKCGVRKKEELFKEKLFGGAAYKNSADDFISAKEVFTLLSGGTVSADKLFLQDEFEEKINISFKKSEEEFQVLLGMLDDYSDFLLRLKEVYDWSLLYEASGGNTYISKAKIEVYEQHKKDLANLKLFIRKYLPEKYNDIFKKPIPGNYVMYSYNMKNVNPNQNKKDKNQKTTKENFCAFINKIVKNVQCEDEDIVFYEDMMKRLSLCTFMPKQVNNDNRVIPYQLYYFELKQLLEKVSNYYPFLNETDTEGYITKDKILSIMEYRIPYYVGPLHSENSSFAWIERKAKGRIYPWNFNEKVDLDKSEAAFINRMINRCSYLPGEQVVPKNSLLYCKFEVLNEINNICINGEKISVECKKGIYSLFKSSRKITKKRIINYLKSNNYMTDADELSGLDITIKSSLKSYHDFKRLLNENMVTEDEVEDIIVHLTYTEDRARIRKYLDDKFAKLSFEDRKYISKIKYSDFGRLSEKFLNGLMGIAKYSETGESVSIMDALWNTNDNLMQIIFSDKYTFKEAIENEKELYYSEHPASIEQLLDDMYISNAVKRPIYRTLDIIHDIRKACGGAPEKIFIEMARGGGEKGKRSISRREQIKNLYKSFDTQEVRELSKLLDSKTDNELQREVLFLYFMQLGKCMYSGKPIDIERLNMETYVNVDHIYPQAYVKDDSLNNKVLVMSKLNGEKGDSYPIKPEIQNDMEMIWRSYKENKLISDEKYYRLTRRQPFSTEEKINFINRQLVETRQSTKAVSEILKIIFPETEVVYVKAGLVTDFKHEFGIIKSREVNDLHHAKDAYLNIVCGNVYHSRFTKQFFMQNRSYSIKTKSVYIYPVKVGGELIWDGEKSVAMVKKIVSKNNIHYTRYAFCRKGGIFDQNPLRAKEGLLPRKKGLSTEKYGGYNKSTATYFLFARYVEKAKKDKRDVMLVPIDLMVSHKVLSDMDFALNYVREEIAEITNKSRDVISDVEFPMGIRPIKVNTKFSFDGFEACITGKDSGGRQVGMVSAMSFIVSSEQEKYIKRLENYRNKKQNNSNIILDEQYDKINKDDNLKLYDTFLLKLSSTFYNKAFPKGCEILQNGREKFMDLDIDEQCIALLIMLNIFKTGRAGTCDLSLIGGSAKTFNYRRSSRVSNWKRDYNSVRIINESASGIYRSESDNILEWL